MKKGQITDFKLSHRTPRASQQLWTKFVQVYAVTASSSFPAVISISALTYGPTPSPRLDAAAIITRPPRP